ncbi:MAG: hypothetical protein MO853_08715 [Candidatus Protistobacter heckmanni]|nr:hypothetical protein [Candidatus Protistobacter heckmanni]
MGLSFGGFILYIASAPDIVVHILKLKETQFAWLFIPVVIGMVSGSWFTNRAAGKASSGQLVRCGYVLMGVAAALNVGYTAFFEPKVPWAALPLLIYVMGITSLSPSLNILALDLFPEKRGMAASLLNFVQLMIFSVLSAVVSPMVYSGALSHALAMAALLLSMSCWMLYRVFRALAAAKTPGQPAEKTADAA